MKKSIGVLYICTGPYVLFWKDFFESFEKNFLPNIEKNILSLPMLQTFMRKMTKM